MSAPETLMLCAVEPSGDALGAALMTALRARAPALRLIGCGGPAMADEGLQSLFDIDPLSVMGPAAALRAMAAGANGANILAQHGAAEGVDAAVFIDSWAFSRLAAARMQKIAPGAKRVKYVAPQVWASRPGRARSLPVLFDGLITLFAFETPLFERHGARVVCGGHPGFQQLQAQRGGGAAFRARHGLGDDAVLVVAPGSRRAEIDQLADRFRRTVDLLRATLGADAPAGGRTLRIVIPCAAGREAMVRAAFAGWAAAPLFIGPDEKTAAFDAATAALAASGTLSTELAICATPMVVAYRFDPLDAFLARRVVTAKFASLINIVADAPIIPEFIQEACAPPAMAEALAALLRDDGARDRQLSAFPAALDELGLAGPPASQRAADAILDWTRD